MLVWFAAVSSCQSALSLSKKQVRIRVLDFLVSGIHVLPWCGLLRFKVTHIYWVFTSLGCSGTVAPLSTHFNSQYCNLLSVPYEAIVTKEDAHYSDPSTLCTSFSKTCLLHSFILFLGAMEWHLFWQQKIRFSYMLNVTETASFFVFIAVISLGASREPKYGLLSEAYVK